LLLSVEQFVEDGLLEASDIRPLADLSTDRVDFSGVIHHKMPLLEKAYSRFDSVAGRAEKHRFEVFRTAATVRPWLPDYSLFCALKDEIGPGQWLNWEPAIRLRDQGAMAHLSGKLAGRIRYHEWLQYQFQRQWLDLKQYANTQGIQIIGDTPIFVSLDSSDVWAHPSLFKLDENARPRVVAGVPPDYFSETGQLWGNPIYDWDEHIKTKFRWWIQRIKTNLQFVDRLRIDHFRGFEACWEIPVNAVNAVNGKWVEAPGHALFDHVLEALGPIPLIAEDLGVITPPVEVLRDKYGFPGMKILQFAWENGAKNQDLPHHYPHNCIVYTGTHDNDTSNGWFASAGRGATDYVRQYLGGPMDGNVAWTFIRAALASVADTAIFPMQDLLSLDTAARMNYPGREEGNWLWRCSQAALTDDLARTLAGAIQTYGR